MITIVDLLENFFGEQITQKTINKLDMLPINRLGELICEHIALFIEYPTLAHNDHGDILQYFLDPLELDFDALHIDGARKYIRRIQNVLLYYPNLYVDCDFPNHVSFYFNPTRDRQYLKYLLEVFVELRELIQRNILIITYIPYSDEASSTISQMGNYDHNDSNLLAVIEGSRALSCGYEESITAESWVDGYNVSQVWASMTNVNWTARNSVMLSIHEYKLRKMGQELSTLEAIELHGIDLLGRINLPAIDTIRPSDLVRIRLQEDIFDEWRSSLLAVLASIQKEVRFSTGFEREFQQYAQLQLLPILRSIEEKHVSKSISQYIRDAAIGFSAGSSAIYLQSMAINSIDIKEALIKLGVSTGTALLASILFKRTTKRTKILRSFYSLFEEKNPKVD